MRAGPSSARDRLSSTLSLLDDKVLASSFFRKLLLRHGT